MSHANMVRGTFCSLGASCLFGIIYYYSTLLAPLDGLEIYGWRMVVTLPCLSLFLLRAGYWHLVTGLADRLRRNKLLIFPLLASSGLLGVQLWLFMWAPINGKALEVSLGYLLMPLAMVLVGRLVFDEQMLAFQKIAVACAAVGVANQLWRVGAISPEVLTVALGFPTYFVLRRKLRTDHLGGLWFDFLFMLPAAFWVIGNMEAPVAMLLEHSRLFFQIPLLGLLSAAGIAGFTVASRLLPLGLFGLLSYVEPMLMVAVSILLGESILPEEILTYSGVGLAVAILALGGARGLLAARQGMERQT